MHNSNPAQNPVYAGTTSPGQAVSLRDEVAMRLFVEWYKEKPGSTTPTENVLETAAKRAEAAYQYADAFISKR